VKQETETGWGLGWVFWWVYPTKPCNTNITQRNHSAAQLTSYLRPFLGEDIKQFILDITLNHNLIVSRHGAAACKTTSKVLARNFQINLCQQQRHRYAATSFRARFLFFYLTHQLVTSFNQCTAGPISPVCATHGWQKPRFFWKKS